jgi:hypothetical protein
MRECVAKKQTRYPLHFKQVSNCWWIHEGPFC